MTINEINEAVADGKISTMKHGLSWQTTSLLHLIGSEGERIVKIANTKLTSSNVP